MRIPKLLQRRKMFVYFKGRRSQEINDAVSIIEDAIINRINPQLQKNDQSLFVLSRTQAVTDDDRKAYQSVISARKQITGALTIIKDALQI